MSKSALQDAWLNSVDPEDKERVALQARQALASRKPFSYEFRILRDGNVHWMISRGKVIRDNNLKPE